MKTLTPRDSTLRFVVPKYSKMYDPGASVRSHEYFQPNSRLKCRNKHEGPQTGGGLLIERGGGDPEWTVCQTHARGRIELLREKDPEKTDTALLK